ncbi:MAG: hypothetical protein OQJ98_03145 [Candidatus Pacebacteria bacterium]|nr:hypothetical protein [Candidatus Paceibacterota bacterium]
MHTFTHIKKSISFLLVLALVAPFGFGFVPETAYAQDAGEFGTGEYNPQTGTGSYGSAAGGILSCVGGGYIDAAIGAGASLIGLVVPTNDAAVTANTGTIKNKDCILDGLTTVIREVLISSITRSIVNWINNGFDGEPAFVSDLEGFMLDVADQVVGRYIEGSELAFLCSPFKIDVKIALALDYYSSARDKAACTLTGAIENVQDAFDDFSNQSAWDAWFDLTINPNNNALGSFLGARQSLRLAIAEEQNRQISILNWGNGFKSYEICDQPTDAQGSGAPVISGGIGNTRINCRIATPGVVINEQLSNTLGSGFRQLELADEINEIIGALLGQLAQQTLGGLQGGLRGLSSSSYSRPSYVDQLVSQSDTGARADFKSYAVSTVEGAIATEQSYISEKRVSLERLNNSESLLESLQACYTGKLSTTFSPTLTTEERQTALNAIASASSTITGSITPLQNLIESEIHQAETTISKLLIIKENLLAASSRTGVERIIADELDPLVRAGEIRDNQDFLIAQQQKEDLKEITDSINQSTNTKLGACESFPQRGSDI